MHGFMFFSTPFKSLFFFFFFLTCMCVCVFMCLVTWVPDFCRCSLSFVLCFWDYGNSQTKENFELERLNRIFNRGWQSFVFSWPQLSVISTVTASKIIRHTHSHNISPSLFLYPSIPHFILCLVFHHWYIIVYIHWRAHILLRNHRSLTVSMCWVLLPVSCLTNVDFINSACGYWCLREK